LGDADRSARRLALPKAVFEVAVERAVSDDGADDVTFLLAPNPGEPARPLAKAASGGELSRAMLALRVVLSEAPPTLVFDEVDAGIGGEAGSAVGRALAGLGGQHQVFCVTHLPQVAAFADAHVAVVKSERKGRTRAGATLLLDDARAELARMLAGDLDPHARAHAASCSNGPRPTVRRSAPDEAAPPVETPPEVVRGIAGRPAHEGFGQAHRSRGDRHHRPPRHRPRRGRVARRRGVPRW
jgi:DNA repair protein RecN (Recombination protein N)